MRNLAVMANRVEEKDELDDFPTPPWAAWALAKMLPPNTVSPNKRVWEPAANRGHLVQGLLKNFKYVYASDIKDYGSGFDTLDFLGDRIEGNIGHFDWIITNPPFVKAEAFLQRALEYEPKYGVALLMRTQWIEGEGRYERVFSKMPFMLFPFAERVAMIKGRFDPDASTATSYSWFVWSPGRVSQSRVQVIPPGWKKKWVQETGWVPVKKPRKPKTEELQDVAL